jgi:tRNA (cmo5U34)-methyltransferase
MDGLVTPADWTFKNRDVADVFDQHVREQLPWYEIATGVAAFMAKAFLPTNGRMFDVGCSTGNMGRALADVITARQIRLTVLSGRRFQRLRDTKQP